MDKIDFTIEELKVIQSSSRASVIKLRIAYAKHKNADSELKENMLKFISKELEIHKEIIKKCKVLDKAE